MASRIVGGRRTIALGGGNASFRIANPINSGCCIRICCARLAASSAATVTFNRDGSLTGATTRTPRSPCLQRSDQTVAQCSDSMGAVTGGVTFDAPIRLAANNPLAMTTPWEIPPGSALCFQFALDAAGDMFCTLEFEEYSL